MPQLDLSTFVPQLFWLVVTFGFLYYLLSKFCLPQLTNIFVRRELQISEDMKAAYLAKDEALRLQSECDLILSNAAKVKSEMLLDASRELAKILEQKLVELDIELQDLTNKSQDSMSSFEVSMALEIDKIANEASKAILIAIRDGGANKESDPKIINEAKKR